MSKSTKLLLASALCLATFIPALAEPAALGRVGVGGDETAAARQIACDSCPAQTAKTANETTTSLTLTSVRPGTASGVAPFATNNNAGQAVINGTDVEGNPLNKGPNGPQPVPEPATIGLIGAGLAALAFGLKRRG